MADRPPARGSEGSFPDADLVFGLSPRVGLEKRLGRILVNVGYVRDIPLGGGAAEGRLLKSVGYRF